MRRVLCFGGTFNPIHYGHLLCAQAVAERAGFEQVLLIPSAVPPLRRDETDMASAVDRMTMCQLAVDGVPLFAVSDIELRRAEPSYTLETAKALQAEGHGPVHWLIGGDALPQLPSWHGYPNLLDQVKFVIMARPGWLIDWELLDIPLQRLRQDVVESPLIDISASGVRQRVRTGSHIGFHVPPAVSAYIREKGLYRGGDEADRR